MIPARYIGTAAVLAAAFLLAPPAAHAGHEISFYPSFYPQEIRIEPLPPEIAAREFAEKKLQAYIGAAPRFAAEVPAHLKTAVSLRSLITARVNPRSPRARHGLARAARAG